MGSLNVDRTVRCERLPAPGETVAATDVVVEPGGKGANQAAVAAQLGAQVVLLGAVGQDDDGDLSLAALRDVGVDVSHVQRTGTPTGSAYVLLDAAAENAILVHAGANATLREDDIATAIGDLDVGAVDGPGPGGPGGRVVLVLGFEVPVPVVLAAARAGRARGWTVILNPAPVRPISTDLAALVDILTPNETEAAALGGGDALRDAGIGAVVVTRGADGCDILTPRAPARNVPGIRARPVNTTGAGDAFTGALAVALSAGASLDDAVHTANAAGALATESPSSRVAGLTADVLADRLG